MNIIAKKMMPNGASKTEPGDDALMQLIAAGDEAAFRRLTEKYRRRMLLLAQRLAGSAADADEILQESFLKVWMAAPSWQADGRARFSTWLHRVVINASLDRKRKRAFSSLEEAEDIEDLNANGFDEAVAAERNAVLRQAMSTLSDRQRSALSLHYFNELSAPEAAQALGISVSSLEASLFRGKRALRDALTLAGALGIIDFL